MTSRQLSAAAKQAAFSQETAEVFIMLLTISHPNWTEDVRLASDSFEELPVAGVRGVISNGLEYLFGAFAITLPTQDETNTTRANITVDNVSREMIRQIRNANSKVSISLQIVLSSDVDTAEMTVSDFKLERVIYDAFTVSGDISLEYFDLEPFPYQRFTPSKFPALF